MKTSRTLYEKIWDDHVVETQADGTAMLYVDRHLVHEVSSPQAFAALDEAGRIVHAPDRTLAVADHNIPTRTTAGQHEDDESVRQVALLTRNVEKHAITFFAPTDVRRGIVHVMGPEQGYTLPGTVVLCGDSHTSTHGALGALAFGIGTTEVEHVLATQTLLQRKSKNMRVNVTGRLPDGVSAKDLILTIIGKIGTGGATGHVIEFAGAAVRALSVEERMTVCNMSIEAGARAGLIAPDDKVFDYLEARPFAPVGLARAQALAYWKTLHSDSDAVFDREIEIDAHHVRPSVTWGTSPEDVVAIDGTVPSPDALTDPERRESKWRALAYMGLRPGQKMTEVALDRIFIGSCTNGRIEDLRIVASIVAGKTIHPRVHGMIVPGSGLVKQQAEAEGLDKIFIAAGFEWRDPGCSMCLAMNSDKLGALERCASTTNRNFEGRQGYKGRTHLVSPAMAAASAIAGVFADARGV